jgi:glycosyltransferase involved in cell wall biosynthesis
VTSIGRNISLLDTPKSPIRLLLVTHYFPAHGGGLEKVAGELAHRLLQMGGITITWIASDCDAAPRMQGLATVSAPAWNFLERVMSVPMPLWSPRMLPVLWRATAAADAVQIHDTLYPGNFVVALMALVRGKPLLVTQHIGMAAYRSRILRGIVACANRFIAAPILRRARQAVFISAAVNGYFNELVRWRRPPLFVPNGVDSQLFVPPTAAERIIARQRLGIPADQAVFIYIGRFVEKKGLPIVADLARDTPDARWLLAGQGPIRPEDWGHPNVSVYRDRSGVTLRELLWASDLLLLPSSSEGFPLVVQEAAACGVPSLVTTEIAAGFPPASAVLLLEPLGEGASTRWLRHLHTFIEERQTPINTTQLAEFARTHWSWEKTSRTYRDILEDFRNGG